jgi:hypothetical protein
MVLAFGGCVSQKDYDELASSYEEAQSEISALSSDAEKSDETIYDLEAQISEVSDYIAIESDLEKIEKVFGEYLDDNYKLEISEFSNDKKILRIYVTSWDSLQSDFLIGMTGLLGEISQNIEAKGIISEFEYVVFEMWTSLGIYGTIQIETSTLDIVILQQKQD